MDFLPFLEKLLRSRLEIINVHGRSFAPRSTIADAIVPTFRLLLAERGEARYTVEGRAFRFGRGMMALIAAGTRRSWSVTRGHAFKLWWVEFQAPAHAPFTHLLRHDCDVRLEVAAFRRLASSVILRGARHTFEAEGELKALLARTLSRAAASMAARAPARRTFGDQAIMRTVEWLGENYARSDALDGLPERAGLSPNHFRVLFKRHCGTTAQAHLTALRMRAARAMLQETGRPVKEIAHALGYADALFFSRHYRAFWKRTPTQDRAFSP